MRRKPIWWKTHNSTAKGRQPLTPGMASLQPGQETTTPTTNTTKRTTKPNTVGKKANGHPAPRGGGSREGSANPTTNENPAENGNATPGEGKRRKRTRASLTLASLNMKGRGSSSPLHPNNKWNLLHQFIKERRIAILAVQETHLDEEYMERLAELYGRILAIYASHSESATTKQGVAIIINRDLVNVNDIAATEIIPGRAIAIEIPWHEDTKLRILNVYGPNDTTENANFWKEIEDYWRTRNMPRLDAIVGDFNVVEDPLDRMPHRSDEHQAVLSLQRFLKY